jgi:hypothetical protein
LNGKPYKVVKYVTDVTEQVVMSQQLQAAVKETQEVVKSATEGDLSCAHTDAGQDRRDRSAVPAASTACSRRR